MYVIGWSRIEEEIRIVFGGGQVYFTGRAGGRRWIRLAGSLSADRVALNIHAFKAKEAL